MPNFPFLSTTQYLTILRVGLGLMMMAHGAARLYVGSVGAFGGFLNSKGLLIGPALAWAITLNDLVGGALLTLGYFRRGLSAGFILVMLGGIALVHWPNGWFVVGHQQGGIEYNVLLILCFLLVASQNPNRHHP
ncbi:DoxX family protein [Rudanella lutea]|uniref:DoxX family protein n=1 Tax=Rudanella lutea TaxID=451374 RepID=UPI000A028A4B|nr:DoxX family protein [Rudanella lutea]